MEEGLKGVVDAKRSTFIAGFIKEMEKNTWLGLEDLYCPESVMVLVTAVHPALEQCVRGWCSKANHGKDYDGRRAVK
jgi:hypothetical protein